MRVWLHLAIDPYNSNSEYQILSIVMIPQKQNRAKRRVADRSTTPYRRSRWRSPSFGVATSEGVSPPTSMPVAPNGRDGWEDSKQPESGSPEFGENSPKFVVLVDANSTLG